MARPFLKWAGGKSQLLDKIPYPEKITKYCEPFVGGGAALFDILEKFDPKEARIFDRNEALINTYSSIRDDANAVISLLKDYESVFLSGDGDARREMYYAVRDEFNAGGIPAVRAAQMIFLNKTCFNGLYRVNRSGKFNAPMGSYAKPVICDGDNLIRISELLRNVDIRCGSYEDSMPFIDGDTFVYLDPPYRPITPTASFTAYCSDRFDDGEQRRLAGFVRDIDAKGAKFALSNSDPKNADPDDDFFDDLYAGYNIKRIPARRSIGRSADSRIEVSELIISNF